MYVSELNLAQFRIYQSLSLNLHAAGVRVHGRNGSGKTSLIEAIRIASTTRSPRSGADRELVAWNSGIDFGVPPFARIECKVEFESEPATAITLGIEQDATNENLFRKRFQLDGQARRAQDVVGILATVLFSPEDVELVVGPPSDRRRQVDVLLSQIDRQYLTSLSRYSQVLSNRNGLLKSFLRDKIDHRSQRAVNEITFWDEQLISHGARIVADRERTLAELAERVRDRAANLISDAEISIRYQPRLSLPPPSPDITSSARTQQIQAQFLQQLQEVRGDEFRRGVTLCGPHRDEVVFEINERDLAAFGSRGQQRLAVIAWKLAESDVIAHRKGAQPVLLLDDVLSELDRVHREMLLELVANQGGQVVVTSTDPEPMAHPSLSALPLLEVEKGTIRTT